MAYRMTEGIRDAVLDLIRDEFDLPEGKVVMGARLYLDLGMDESHWELAAHVEEKFEIDIPDSECEGWVTVGDVVNTVLLRANAAVS